MVPVRNPEALTPPLVVPPSSNTRTWNVEVPKVSAAGVKVKSPLASIEGPAENNEGMLTPLTSYEDTLWLATEVTSISSV